MSACLSVLKTVMTVIPLYRFEPCAFRLLRPFGVTDNMRDFESCDAGSNPVGGAFKGQNADGQPMCTIGFSLTQRMRSTSYHRLMAGRQPFKLVAGGQYPVVVPLAP